MQLPATHASFPDINRSSFFPGPGGLLPVSYPEFPGQTHETKKMYLQKEFKRK
jgi:hypothetical protein